MVSILLCKPLSIVGLSTTITRGGTSGSLLGMSVVLFYLVHHTCVSMVTVFIIIGLPWLILSPRWWWGTCPFQFWQGTGGQFPLISCTPSTSHLEVPYVIIGDVAFLLCTNMLRPYPRGNLTGVCVVFRLTWRHNSHCFIIAEEKAVFNYRLLKIPLAFLLLGIALLWHCSFVT